MAVGCPTIRPVAPELDPVIVSPGWNGVDAENPDADMKHTVARVNPDARSAPSHAGVVATLPDPFNSVRQEIVAICFPVIFFSGVR